MVRTDTRFLSLTEVSAMLQAREVSPVELTEACFELIAQSGTMYRLFGFFAAHGPAGTVTRGSKGPGHRGTCADQHPAGRAHGSGHQNRLADIAVGGRQLG